jgi:hypothetical protein
VRAVPFAGSSLFFPLTVVLMLGCLPPACVAGLDSLRQALVARLATSLEMYEDQPLPVW